VINNLLTARIIFGMSFILSHFSLSVLLIVSAINASYSSAAFVGVISGMSLVLTLPGIGLFANIVRHVRMLKIKVDSLRSFAPVRKHLCHIIYHESKRIVACMPTKINR
jgi:hypothetical protein